MKGQRVRVISSGHEGVIASEPEEVITGGVSLGFRVSVQSKETGFYIPVMMDNLELLEPIQLSLWSEDNE